MENSRKSSRSRFSHKFVDGFDKFRVFIILFKLFPDILLRHCFFHTSHFVHILLLQLLKTFDVTSSIFTDMVSQ